MIIPSITEVEFDEIKRKVDKIDGVSSIIQIDICDGKLFEGKTFLDFHKLENLKTTSQLELHLMVKDPNKYLDEKLVNFDKIIAQVEGENIKEFALKAKHLGYKVGLALSPETPNFIVEELLELVDYIQFMAIEPGAQGRPFDERVIKKIATFKSAHPEVKIQIDGHMNKETILKLKALNIDNYAVGSAIFNEADPVVAKAELESLLNS